MQENKPYKNIEKTISVPMRKGFQEGNQVSKGKGRPKGSKSKKPTIQHMIDKLWHMKYQDLSFEYDHMRPNQKLKFWEIMLPFATPKLAAKAVENRYEKITKEDAKMLVEELRQRVVTNKQPQPEYETITEIKE